MGPEQTSLITRERSIQRMSFRLSNRWKAVILLVSLGLSLYVYSFFRYRKALIYSGHPLTYVFSTDPVEHRRAISFFYPLIFLSGGQLQSQWNLRNPAQQLEFRDAPMYPDSFTPDSIFAFDHWPEGGFDDPDPKYWLRGGHVPLLPVEEDAQTVWDPDDIKENKKIQNRTNL